eukprot:656512-Amphidinium_carterae.1
MTNFAERMRKHGRLHRVFWQLVYNQTRRGRLPAGTAIRKAAEDARVIRLLAPLPATAPAKRAASPPPAGAYKKPKAKAKPQQRAAQLPGGHRSHQTVRPSASLTMRSGVRNSTEEDVDGADMCARSAIRSTHTSSVRNAIAAEPVSDLGVQPAYAQTGRQPTNEGTHVVTDTPGLPQSVRRRAHATHSQPRAFAVPQLIGEYRLMVDQGARQGSSRQQADGS